MLRLEETAKIHGLAHGKVQSKHLNKREKYSFSCDVKDP